MSELLDIDAMEREYQHCNDTREAGCYHFHARAFKAIAELRELRGVRREAQRLEEENDDRRHDMVALAKRVEELEKLLGDAGEAEATFHAFLLTAHARYPSSHPDYYSEQGKVAETRCAVWSEQRRIAERRKGRAS